MSDMIEKLKKNKTVFSMLEPEEQECFKKVGKKNCLVHNPDEQNPWHKPSSDCSFARDSTYAIKPDYQPEPDLEAKNKLIGKTAIVYDRYHFALPIKGRIEDVAERDGAYQINFYSDQHGYPNYMDMNHTYFFSQQCQIVEENPQPEPEPEDIEITQQGNRLGIVRPLGVDFSRFPHDFTHLGDLTSLPKFEGFYLKGKDTEVNLENVARYMPNVVARFRV